MLTEDEGVKAIQFLLALSGDNEPEEISRKNWKEFSDFERKQTEYVYNLMKSRKN